MFCNNVLKFNILSGATEARRTNTAVLNSTNRSFRKMRMFVKKKLREVAKKSSLQMTWILFQATVFEAKKKKKH